MTWTIRRVTAMLAAGLALACSVGAPSQTAGQTPVQGAPGTLTPENPNQPPAGGATTFHLVLTDGPKAGTYDVTSTQPGACSNVEQGYWAALFDAFGESGLTGIAASLQPNVRGLTYGFDTGSDNQLSFVGVGEVTFNVDDRGSTATFTVVSESNLGTHHSDFSTVQTGRAELTVQCASILRSGG